MKCINKKQKISFILAMLFLITTLLGCGNTDFSLVYDYDIDISSFQVFQRENKAVANTFASNLCIATEELTYNPDLDMSNVSAAVLFDVSKKEVLYSKNPYDEIYPASITKVMTAYLALKYGSLDQVLTATPVIHMEDPDATRIKKMREGDTMTLYQALHIILIYSANDVANMIAEGISGSVEEFVELMNEEAAALGATNTHFTNANGLPDPNHYSTAYDLYLIFNEAMKNEIFREIINMSSYTTTYYDKNGNPKNLDIKTTNRYFRGDYETPETVTIIGGKTGTTDAAGHCLILLSRDINSNLYISIIMCSDSRDNLYGKMTDLLSEIGK